MSNMFKGTGPAVITPFKESDLSIDFDSLEKVLEYQISEGIDFIVALGTTAETVTLTHSERHSVYNHIKKINNKRLPLMVGFGGNNTAEVIEHIKSADFEGIDAILSVVPYYNKPTQEGIYRHFMAIADVCPVPIVLYNVPSRTGVNMTDETTLRIAHESKKIIGVKEASGDIEQIKRIIAGAPDDFVVLSGDDAKINEIAAVGGNGVISVMANAFPREVVELTKKSIENAELAKPLQKSCETLIDLLFVDGNPAGVKAVLHQRGIIDNVLRLPLCPVSDDTYSKIAAVLNAK